ncbi:MAG: hypothetical protein ACI4KB_11080 [Oscillospiraceae bacterium]
MPAYSQQKRVKHDFCNICGKLSDLTWDHVPPKACRNSISVKFNHLMDGIPEFNDYKMISQNGIRFRSLCSDCNNTLLGKEYDPELVKFTSGVVSYIDASLEQGPPGIMDLSALGICKVKIKVNRVARAICGHILAAKNEYDNQTISDSKFREFFLNPSAQPPQNYRLLMWFYPYSTIIIARDFVVKKVENTPLAIPEGMCSIVSSFPIAYILCNDQYSGTLCNLFDYCTTDIDEEKLITIDFTSCLLENGRLRHPVWPAYVSNTQDGVDMLFASKYTTTSSVLGIRNLKL